ncbi:MAG: hypothetical protein IKV14_03245 [Muribaculaceae bacterium]|nr:hypothetical protein [Muribaculaceae bacterium]
MIGIEDDSLLALINDNNNVIGSVSFSEYKKNPRKYKVLFIRVILLSEEKEFIFSTESFFDGSMYDTPYSTILKLGEDYETAFERLSKALPSVDMRFLLRYYKKSEKYDFAVCFYFAQQKIEEVKKYQEGVVLYPSEIGTDDVMGNDILFEEIDFIKKHIIPNLNLDINGNKA